ncbi:MAG: amino acid permease, partial [Wolbachia pipientis]
MSNKIGFLAIFALVISSQIGSGIFMLPISLAPYGAYSLISWVISGFGAISLALVFASLCAKFPETGGPHIYVKHAFGSTAAFFVGWTYWVSSWVSSTAVTIASIGYLAPLFHN